MVMSTLERLREGQLLIQPRERVLLAGVPQEDALQVHLVDVLPLALATGPIS